MQPTGFYWFYVQSDKPFRKNSCIFTMVMSVAIFDIESAACPKSWHGISAKTSQWSERFQHFLHNGHNAVLYNIKTKQKYLIWTNLISERSAFNYIANWSAVKDYMYLKLYLQDDYHCTGMFTVPLSRFQQI